MIVLADHELASATFTARVAASTNATLFNCVAAAISSAETDITHIEMGDERLGETAELKLTVAVRDTDHLAEVMRTLRRCPASRWRWAR